MGRKSTLSKRTQRLAGQNLAYARRTAKSARKAAKSGWHDITDTFDTAVDRSQQLAGDARSRRGGAQSKFDEVRRRTRAARDALAGKRPPRRRPWVAGAAAMGVVFGAAGAVYARRLAAARGRARAEVAAAAVAADLAAADAARSGGALNGHVDASAATASTAATPTPVTKSTSKVTTPRTGLDSVTSRKSTDPR